MMKKLLSTVAIALGLATAAGVVTYSAPVEAKQALCVYCSRYCIRTLFDGDVECSDHWWGGCESWGLCVTITPPPWR